MVNITLILEVKNRDTDEIIIREEAYSLESLEEKLYRVERAIKALEEFYKEEKENNGKQDLDNTRTD